MSLQFNNTCAHLPFHKERKDFRTEEASEISHQHAKVIATCYCNYVGRRSALYHSFASLGSSLIAIHKSSYVQQALYESSIARKNILEKIWQRQVPRNLRHKI